MPKRRARFPHRYTMGRLTRDGKRVPLVHVSRRWLEAFGFKEGAKYTAIGAQSRGAAKLRNRGTVLARGILPVGCDLTPARR